MRNTSNYKKLWISENKRGPVVQHRTVSLDPLFGPKADASQQPSSSSGLYSVFLKYGGGVFLYSVGGIGTHNDATLRTLSDGRASRDGRILPITQDPANMACNRL